MSTYQSNESPRRLVVQKLETVAFQVEHSSDKHKQKGESKSPGVVWWSKYSHLQTDTTVCSYTQQYCKLLHSIMSAVLPTTRTAQLIITEYILVLIVWSTTQAYFVTVAAG